MGTYFVVSTATEVTPETIVDSVHADLGAAVQSATSAMDAARYKDAKPKYVYEVVITPKHIVKQVTTTSVEAVSGDSNPV